MLAIGIGGGIILCIVAMLLLFVFQSRQSSEYFRARKKRIQERKKLNTPNAEPDPNFQFDP